MLDLETIVVNLIIIYSTTIFVIIPSVVDAMKQTMENTTSSLQQIQKRMSPILRTSKDNQHIMLW